MCVQFLLCLLISSKRVKEAASSKIAVIASVKSYSVLLLDTILCLLRLALNQNFRTIKLSDKILSERLITQIVVMSESSPSESFKFVEDRKTQRNIA